MTVTISGTNGIDKVASGVVDATALAAGSVTQPKVGSGVAGNGPAFRVKKAGNTSLSAGTATKIALDTEDFDTNNCFDTSTSRFTPNVAGYYQITGVVEGSAGLSVWFIAYIFKNGSNYGQGSNFPVSASAGPTTIVSQLVYLNGTTDYVELYAASSAASTAYGGFVTCFQGALVRAA